jgi:hypothetical protein
LLTLVRKQQVPVSGSRENEPGLPGSFPRKVLTSKTGISGLGTCSKVNTIQYFLLVGGRSLVSFFGKKYSFFVSGSYYLWLASKAGLKALPHKLLISYCPDVNMRKIYLQAFSCIK